MTIDELYALALTQDPAATRDGNVIAAGGNLHLSSVATLPEGVTLSAGGYLDLTRLTTLSEGCTLSAGGSLDLTSVTTLPEGCTLSAGGYLDLSSVTTMPEGVTLSAGRNLYLYSLTTLPECCTLSARLTIFANSIDQAWNGRHLLSVDSILMDVRQPHAVDGGVVHSAKWAFSKKQETVYCAKVGDYWAHGKTVADAIDDARFKALEADPSGVVAEIKSTGIVTREQYRAITGACRLGTKAWCESHGVGDSLPLKRALAMLGDAYGAERFRDLIGGAE